MYYNKCIVINMNYTCSVKKYYNMDVYRSDEYNNQQ